MNIIYKCTTTDNSSVNLINIHKYTDILGILLVVIGRIKLAWGFENE